jgi:sortase A
MAAIGRTLIGVATLLVLFVAYQLWGTGLAESHGQATLRHELSGRLPAPIAPTATPKVARPAPPTPAPPDGGAIGMITVPKVGLDKAIVEGTTTADLRQGPGHYRGTSLPGQPGNAGIAGHRTTYGAPFSRLNELVAGDLVSVTTPQGSFRYDVTHTFVVQPSDLSVIAPSSTNELTLTTCTPRYSASQRLVVQALLSGPPAPAASAPPGQGRAGSTLGGSTGSWLPTIAWGVVTAAVALAVWFITRRGHRRWLVCLLGVPALLAALFFFFGAVSNVLPASV